MEKEHSGLNPECSGAELATGAVELLAPSGCSQQLRMPRTPGDFVVQVDRVLATGSSGPEAYALVRRYTVTQFDDTDQSEPFQRLGTFRVPSGTEFSAARFVVFRFSV